VENLAPAEAPTPQPVVEAVIDATEAEVVIPEESAAGE
jgi:hypothetical protein